MNTPKIFSCSFARLVPYYNVRPADAGRTGIVRKGLDDKFGPVVQWIVRKSPELDIPVRFWAGLQILSMFILILEEY